jgi:hypothetical protein
MRRYISIVAIALALSGCAMAPTHDDKVSGSLASAAQGNIEAAIAQIESQTQDGKKNDFLLNLEKAELMRIANQYANSQAAFLIADSKINEWEATAKSEPSKLMSNIGATIMGDTFRTYEGQDYEKVMLTTRMAMNNIALGDLDTARVDIKRTHEREAVIAEFRAKETFEAQQEAEAKGVKANTQELNGYPVETLNDPEVLALKNGFQNALSHYLSGFVYEALNEPGLAAPGYRQAIELRPGLPLLEQGLADLDQRTGFRRRGGKTDVLFVVETGNAPMRKSKKLTLPIPISSGFIAASYAFPVIYPDTNDAIFIKQIAFGEQTLPAAMLADFNVMARRSLKDEMVGIQVRAAVRAIAKAVIQNQLNRQSSIAGLIGNIAAVATESPADDRMWRGLPGRVFIARSFIAPGEYPLSFSDLGPETKTIKIDGRYMVVPVRIYHGKIYFGEPAQFGKLDPAPAPVVKQGKQSSSKSKAKKPKNTKNPAAQ